MRNFEYERLNATHLHSAFRTDDLSWSPAQHRLLSFCERAYFIRYFVTRGGWDAAAHPIVKTAYFEKWFPTRNTWLGMTVEKALLDAITVSLIPLYSPKNRRMLLIRNFYDNLSEAEAKFQHSVRNRLYLDDYKQPCTSEIFHGTWTDSDLNEYFAEIHKILMFARNSLISSRIFDELTNFSYLEFRLEDKFLSVPWGGYNLWVLPGIYFISQTTAIRLRCRFSDGPENPLFNNGINTDSLDCALFAEYCLRTSIPRYSCNMTFNFNHDSYGMMQTAPDIDLFSVVKSDMEFIFGKIDQNCYADISAFPKTELPDRCGFCRYRKACRLLDAQAEK